MARKKVQEERAVSTSQKVESFIRRAIYDGRLKPRERIIEDDIARELGCSRGPVREAVLRLERDGMIVITPRRGTFIRDITPEEIEVAFGVRGKLEGLCVRYMREDMTPEKERAILKCLKALKAAASSHDQKEFFQADMRLHSTIWKQSGKLQLYRILNFVMNPLFFMIARTYTVQLSPLEASSANHERYVTMILTTPIPYVERKVEKYWGDLYRQLNATVFHRSAPPLRVLDEPFRESFEDPLNFD
jgi:DNA-binding GntR family transcriptional regulator